MYAKLTVLASALVSLSATANSPYSDVVFFGDSLSDSGYFAPAIAKDPSAKGYAQEARYTTNPDTVWTQNLGEKLGHTVTPDAPYANQDGNNYAVGGARADVSDVEDAFYINGKFSLPVFSAKEQVATYLAKGVKPDALHSVWIGANDVRRAANADTTKEAQEIVLGAIAGEVAAVQALHDNGAKYILLPNLPNIGMVPGIEVLYKREGAAVVAAKRQEAEVASATYNRLVLQKLAGTGANIIPLDTFTLSNEVSANPAIYGIDNVTGLACYNGLDSRKCDSTNPKAVKPDYNDNYFFADFIHPTGKVHRMLADYAYSVVTTPTEVAKLPHFATTQGLQTQAMVSQMVATQPTGFWANVNRSNGDSAGFDSKNTTLVAGAGYKPELINGKVGAFVSHTTGDYQKDRLSANIDMLGLGVYHTTSWARLGLDSQVQLGFANMDSKLKRQFVMDTYNTAYNAKADGKLFYANAQVQKPITVSGVNVAPYVSATAVRVHQDALRENSPSSTAMTFDEQKYNTVYASAGVSGKLALSQHVNLNGDVHYQKRLSASDNVPTARLNTLQNVSFHTPSPKLDDGSFGASLGVSATLAKVQAGAFVNYNKGDDDKATSVGLSIGRIF